jgi:putative addiction module killer protein
MFDGQPKEIIVYETNAGLCPFAKWLAGLHDREAQTRIEKRLYRLRGGNPGDYQSVGAGVYELRIDYGPGYRLYFALAGARIILLLCGGDKSTQMADIKQAKRVWKEYQQRVK